MGEARIITPEQMVKDTLALLEKYKIPQLLAEASPKERNEMLLELTNMFGGRFPRG